MFTSSSTVVLWVITAVSAAEADYKLGTGEINYNFSIDERCSMAL